MSLNLSRSDTSSVDSGLFGQPSLMRLAMMYFSTSREGLMGRTDFANSSRTSTKVSGVWWSVADFEADRSFSSAHMRASASVEKVAEMRFAGVLTWTCQDEFLRLMDAMLPSPVTGVTEEQSRDD